MKDFFKLFSGWEEAFLVICVGTPCKVNLTATGTVGGEWGFKDAFHGIVQFDRFREEFSE